jgi:hypothetical protein
MRQGLVATGGPAECFSVRLGSPPSEPKLLTFRLIAFPFVPFVAKG